MTVSLVVNVLLHTIYVSKCPYEQTIQIFHHIISVEDSEYVTRCADRKYQG